MLTKTKLAIAFATLALGFATTSFATISAGQAENHPSAPQRELRLRRIKSSHGAAAAPTINPAMIAACTRLAIL